MIKKLLYFLFIFSLSFASQKAEAQPNDFQCSPNELGLLPNAPPCGSGGGITYGSPVTQVGSTISATSDHLSGIITPCFPSGNLNDVWFRFTASETDVEITLQGVGGTPLKDPYVAIYESIGDECVGLVPRDCFSASGGGAHTFNFGPLTYGVKYYLQIASTTASGAGAFNFVIKSKNVCADCLKHSVLQPYPLPVKAAYPPDTTVGFCYSVIGYDEQYGNRLHGIVPVFGNGWDQTSFHIYSIADSVDMLGQWKWFTGVNVGGTLYNGFFYDVGGDGDPTNNLGDHGNFASIWTFCYSIKTKPQAQCTSGSNDLSIRFLNFSDGESGSLVTTHDCSGDEDYVFDAHMDCCSKPYYAYATAAGCNNTANGSINAYGGFSVFGMVYTLYNSAGMPIDTVTAGPTTPYSNSTLLPGNYYLYMHANTAGACETAVNILVPGPVDYDIHQTVYGCGTGTCTNSALITVNSGSVTSATWTDSGGSVIGTGLSVSGLCPGWNYVSIVDTGSVACTISDSVFITNFPFASPAFAYSKTFYCTSDSIAYLTGFPAAGGGTFTILAAPAGITSSSINGSTGIINLTTATAAGPVIVKYASSPPCVSSSVDTINVQLSPAPPLATDYPSQNVCLGNNANPYVNTGSLPLSWYADPGLISLLINQASGSSYDFFGGSPVTTAGNNDFYLAYTNSSGTCHSVPLQVNINVYNAPSVNAGPNVTVCPGFGANLNVTGASSYIWSPAGFLNNAAIQNPIATLSQTTVFTVVGTDATSGCSASDSVTVIIDTNGSCDIVAYNGFTPNGDGHNDSWYIDGISVDKQNVVSIFNRWGEKVWATTGYDNQSRKWEGNSFTGGALPDGTYFYVIKFKNSTLKGYVELTR
ncbi:MAG: T9SS type B sorting domain-containing protein [Bacteroidia bacterium]